MDQDPKMQGGDTENNSSPVANNTNSEQAVPVANAAPSETIIFSETVTSTSPTPAQSQPAAPAQTNQNQPTVSPANPPKKNHTGLIVAVIAVVVALLAGIGAAVWYFVIYSNPDKVAYDAVENLLRADAISISGSGSAKSASYDGSYTELSYTLNSQAKTFEAGSADSKIQISHYDEDGKKDEFAVDVDFGTVAVSDGVFYFRVGNLMENVDGVMELSGTTYDELPEYAQSLYQLGEEVDGEWWRLSVSEIFDKVAEFTDEDVTPAKKLYTCVTDIYKNNPSRELSEMYSQHPFVMFNRVSETTQGYKLNESGKSAYTMNLNLDELAGFINLIPKSSFAHEYVDCVNDYIDEISATSPYGDLDDVSEVDASNWSSPEGIDNFYFIITNLSHQLSSIIYEDKNAFSRLDLNYASTTIEQPSNYRSAMELFDDVVEIIQQAFGNRYEEPISWNDYGYTSIGTFSFYDDIECDHYEYLDDDMFECYILTERDDDDFWHDDDDSTGGEA